MVGYNGRLPRGMRVRYQQGIGGQMQRLRRALAGWAGGRGDDETKAVGDRCSERRTGGDKGVAAVVSQLYSVELVGLRAGEGNRGC
jgi:hypothetical protein